MHGNAVGGMTESRGRLDVGVVRVDEQLNSRCLCLREVAFSEPAIFLYE